MRFECRKFCGETKFAKAFSVPQQNACVCVCVCVYICSLLESNNNYLELKKNTRRPTSTATMMSSTHKYLGDKIYKSAFSFHRFQFIIACRCCCFFFLLSFRFLRVHKIFRFVSHSSIVWSHGDYWDRRRYLYMYFKLNCCTCASVSARNESVCVLWRSMHMWKIDGFKEKTCV